MKCLIHVTLHVGVVDMNQLSLLVTYQSIASQFHINKKLRDNHSFFMNSNKQFRRILL